MGFTYPPIIGDSSLYNPRFYPSLGADGTLTYEYAQTLYLSKNDFRLSYLSGVIPGAATSGSALVLDETLSMSGLGSVSCSALTVAGVAVGTLPAFLDSITPGTAANNKALVLDGLGAIATITSLTATNIFGSIKTAAQPNITSIGTLSSLTVSGSITGTLATPSQTNITSIGTLSSLTVSGSITGLLATAAQTNITSVGTLSSLTVSGSITGTLSTAAQTNITSVGTLSSLTVSGSITGTLSTAAQTNITSVGTLSNLTLSTGGLGISIPSIKIWDAVSSTYKTLNHNYYIDIVEGGCSSQKALVVDLNKDVGSIRNLSCTGTFTASTSVSTPSLTCDTITKSGTQTMTATTLNLNPTALQLRGTTITSSATEINILSGCTASTAELNYLDITTTGVGQASKALVLNASSMITSGITSLSATTLISTQATQMLTTSGTTLTTTSRASEYQTLILNSSPTTGATSAIAFSVDDSALNTYTPSVALIATRTATSLQYAMADFAIQTRSSSNILSPMVNRLVVKQAGGIGIGTSAPTGSVHIIGSGSYLAGSWQRIMAFANDDATTPIRAEIQIVDATSGTSSGNGLWFGTITADPIKFGCGNSSIMYINSSGRVGINLSASSWSPEADLHVNGQIWSNSYFYSKQNVDGKAVYRTNWSQSNYLAWGTDATVGAMRLGTCDANFAWVAYAPVRGGAYTNASDQRLKRDIIDIPYGLDEVMRMQPRRFAMRNDNSSHVGFIAQSMLDIIPECVSGIESADDELNDQGEPINPMGIDLASLTSVLCRAIQELKAEVDELRTIISKA